MSKRHPQLLQCGSYHAGHQAHWIQVIHGGRDEENPAIPGVLLGVSDDGTLRVQIGETIRRLWHHQPLRLVELAGRNDGAIDLQMRWSLLRTPSPDGWYCFSVCEADSASRQPCPDPDDPPPDDFLELIKERGGFDLPVDDVAALVARSATGKRD